VDSSPRGPPPASRSPAIFFSSSISALLGPSQLFPVTQRNNQCFSFSFASPPQCDPLVSPPVGPQVCQWRTAVCGSVCDPPPLVFGRPGLPASPRTVPLGHEFTLLAAALLQRGPSPRRRSRPWAGPAGSKGVVKGTLVHRQTGTVSSSWGPPAGGPPWAGRQSRREGLSPSSLSVSA